LSLGLKTRRKKKEAGVEACLPRLTAQGETFGQGSEEKKSRGTPFPKALRRPVARERKGEGHVEGEGEMKWVTRGVHHLGKKKPGPHATKGWGAWKKTTEQILTYRNLERKRGS